MNNEEQKLREFAEALYEGCFQGIEETKDEFMQITITDLTSLISEGYVSKEEHEKVLQQRDELREALERIANPIAYMERNLKEGERLNGIMALRISENAQYLKEIAEAAIKNTDG